MKPRSHRRHGPVVVPALRAKPRARRRPGDELLSAEALETPMPGPLLVLLSRLHRCEEKPGGKTSLD